LAADSARDNSRAACSGWRDEAGAQFVIARISGHHRRQELEGSRQIRQHVLPQNAESPLHLDPARAAHLLELEAQHRNGAIGATGALVSVGERRRRARRVRTILQQPLRRRQRGGVVRNELQHALDVSERSRHVLQRAQAQIDELLAQQQRFCGPWRRLALERLLEHFCDLFVATLGQQATYQPFARRFVTGCDFQDALTDVYRQVVSGRGIVE
jgi:hypothetical protein